MEKITIGVVGGGAAGMAAAIWAARSGAEVTILEHMDRVGKKILSTGNGKCNLTNQNLSSDYFHSENLEFADQILVQFGLEETIRFFLELGIYTKNRNGGLYPYSEQASAVLDVLRMELKKRKVSIQCGVKIKEIKAQKGFLIITENSRMHFDRVILASGSRAAAATGSDGSGYQFARAFGHKIIKPLPALTQLKSDAKWLKGTQGVRCDAKVSLYIEGQKRVEDRGELQLVEYGISGIPVFQISGLAARALDRGEKTDVLIDFLPDFSRDYLKSFLINRLQASPHKTMEEAFIGLFNKKMIPFLLKVSDFKMNDMACCFNDVQIEKLIQCMKECRISISETNGFQNAQTCTGGVDTHEISQYMESRLVPGLFFAGEVVDVDGLCGGYNLQWAWSTGYVAGKSAAK